MTLSRLMNEMTYEEMLLWSAFFSNQNDDFDEQMSKSARR